MTASMRIEDDEWDDYEDVIETKPQSQRPKDRGGRKRPTTWKSVSAGYLGYRHSASQALDDEELENEAWRLIDNDGFDEDDDSW